MSRDSQLLSPVLKSQPRTLVLCFDGTSNEYDGTNTNVVKLFSLLNKDDPERQVCYYQPGIGTYFKPGVVSPVLQRAATLLDEAVAWYLDQHVMDGYRFIMQTYRSGDKICIFGFSRGAYTARALAGMLYKVGLLPKNNEEQVPFAYKLYVKRGQQAKTLSEGFKKTFCQNVKVEFVGVWDTVSSVGIISGKTLPFTDANSAITTFRHALSLDEHRAKFRPNFYHWPSPLKATTAKKTTVQGSSKRLSFGDKLQSLFKRKGSKEPSGKSVGGQQKSGSNGTSESEALLGSSDETTTDVVEVWFCGGHGDVGGGVALDSAKFALADIPLRWMVHEVINAQCGVLFKPEALESLDISNDSFAKESKAKARKMIEDDVAQPVYDALKKNWMWWLLEIIPLSYDWQDADGVWHKTWSIHMGKGRYVPANPLFHISVKDRMADATYKYKPRAMWTAGTETYVA